MMNTAVEDATLSFDNNRRIHYDDNEGFSLVWFNTSIKYRKIQKRLRAIINHVKMFDNSKECLNYMHQTSGQDRIIFLVDYSKFARKVISNIHQLRQVVSIYAYCKDRNTYKRWRKTYPKVRIVHGPFRKLLSRIRTDQEQRIIFEEPLVINIFHANVGQSTTSLNGQFVFSQLLIDVLLRIQPNPTDFRELVSYCEKTYARNRVALSKIQEFQETYKADSALSWYTRDSFFYRMLNQALRLQNIDLLFLFRPCIQDIYQNLMMKQYPSSIQVYRGQCITNDELNTLKESIGQFISFNSFLSTSKERDIAKIYAERLSDDLQSVLFEIDADPQVTSTKPFADISFFSHLNDESEVLFMIGSIFQLVDVCLDHEEFWLVRMKLCSDDKHDSKSIIEYIKQEYEEADAHLGTLGIVLADMGRLNEAEKYFIHLQKELSSDDPLLVGLYCNLGQLADQKGDYDTSLKWYRKSLKLSIKTCPSDYANIGNTYNCIGLIYQQKGFFNRALKIYQTALSILQQASTDNRSYIESVYSNIGIIYQLKGQLFKALLCYKRSLTLRKRHLPRHHPNIAGSCNNIGGIYYSLAELDLALKYFNRSLKIRLKSLPSEHEDVAMSYANIALVYEDRGDLEQALIYFHKAANTIRNVLPSDHRKVIRIENDIQRVSSMNNVDR